jgi:hypothetical protein
MEINKPCQPECQPDSESECQSRRCHWQWQKKRKSVSSCSSLSESRSRCTSSSNFNLNLKLTIFSSSSFESSSQYPPGASTTKLICIWYDESVALHSCSSVFDTMNFLPVVFASLFTIPHLYLIRWDVPQAASPRAIKALESSCKSISAVFYLTDFCRMISLTLHRKDRLYCQVQVQVALRIGKSWCAT